jgi:hypothetical protein
MTTLQWTGADGSADGESRNKRMLNESFGSGEYTEKDIARLPTSLPSTRDKSDSRLHHT